MNAYIKHELFQLEMSGVCFLTEGVLQGGEYVICIHTLSWDFNFHSDAVEESFSRMTRVG